MGIDINIRRALETENEQLTQISFRSKQVWNYPAEYFDSWRSELTITPEYIKKHLVFVAERAGQVVGYYSVLFNPKDFWTRSGIFFATGYWLEHMFILPEHIGQGIGTALMRHAKEQVRSLRGSVMRILVDPNAKGFYEKMGARYIKDVLSSIPGRTTPFYELSVDK